MHLTRRLLTAGMLACAGGALAQLNLETDATLHDYPSLSDGRGKNNPPFCETGYDNLDLDSITAYCAMDKITCGACLNVCGSKGCKYLLAMDRCTRTDGMIDMSVGAGQQIGGATTGHLKVKVTQVDASKCAHIWNGRMFFPWLSPYGGLATLKDMAHDMPPPNRASHAIKPPFLSIKPSPLAGKPHPSRRSSVTDTGPVGSATRNYITVKSTMPDSTLTTTITIGHASGVHAKAKPTHAYKDARVQQKQQAAPTPALHARRSAASVSAWRYGRSAVMALGAVTGLAFMML